MIINANANSEDDAESNRTHVESVSTAQTFETFSGMLLTSLEKNEETKKRKRTSHTVKFFDRFFRFSLFGVSHHFWREKKQHAEEQNVITTATIVIPKCTNGMGL